MTRRKSALFMRAGAMALAVAVASLSATAASAQSTGADRRISVSIASQSLSDALRELAETSGLQLVYDTRITDEKTAPGVSGSMTARAAITALLAGSGLNVQFSGDRTAIITSTPAGAGRPGLEDGVRAVGVVNVEGAGGPMRFGELASPVNGVNGSRDVQATEGTGSYTTGAATIGSKLPQELRETPASVSVMTSQLIEDQALVSVRDIVEKLTGVTVTTGPNSEEFDFSSRGFTIQQLTIDGGAPLIFEYNNRPVIDMAQFDSVQLLRGADGLFGGYGDPGGAVNLQRKKPLDHRQITYEQDIGSWSNFREELDLTGPLALEGRLRGRLVLSRIDKEHFFEIAESKRSFVYGVMEYDVASATLLTFGASYAEENNVPNQGGLPRYSDGGEIDFPRSTCFCVPWAYDDATRSEVFLTLDHQFNSSLSSRLNVTYSDQQTAALYFSSTASVIRDGAAFGALGGFSTSNPLKQLSLDFSTNGKFGLFGREHSFVFGGSYQDVDNGGGQTTYGYPGFPIPDIFDFDPSSYAEPATPTPDFRSLKNYAQIYGAYGNIRFQILEDLHFSVGLRYSSYKDSSVALYSFSPDPQVSPALTDQNISDPTFGLTYDFLDNFTFYGSYQTTYRPQIYARYASSAFDPPPVTGENQEVGVKWRSDDGRLNAFISTYETTQNGFVSESFSSPGTSVPILQDSTSQGIDFEVAGELRPGLQVSLGYTYNENEIITSGYDPIAQKTVPVASPRSSYTPHHLLKAWVTYRGREGGRLDGYTFGAGMNLQSSAFASGFICPVAPVDRFNPPAYCSADGTSTGAFLNSVPYEFITDGYATFSARFARKLTDHVELAVNLDNITVVKTYASDPFQNPSSYNYYVEPRSFVVSLRARW